MRRDAQARVGAQLVSTVPVGVPIDFDNFKGGDFFGLWRNADRLLCKKRGRVNEGPLI